MKLFLCGLQNYIFDSFSATAKQNPTKLDKQENSLSSNQVCVFRADQKNKMATLISDCLRHTKFNEHNDLNQVVNFLFQVCVFQSDQKTKTATLISYLLRHFQLLRNCWMDFNEILAESKNSTSFTMICIFESIGKLRWLPWLLIDWDIFERNSTKLDRKQVLKVLYQVCVFRTVHKTKMAALAPIGGDIFGFPFANAEWNSMKLDKKQDLDFLY